MTNLCVEITHPTKPLNHIDDPEAEIGICILSAINLIEINNDDELAMYLLNEGKVAVVPGSAFGMPGHLRLSIALDLKNLEKAMARIKKALNNNE